MMPREMTPMYIQDDGFQPPKVEGLISHFLVLHRMMRKTITSRIRYSEAIPYERNLLVLLPLLLLLLLTLPVVVVPPLLLLPTPAS
jgi:hypothetical protein